MTLAIPDLSTMSDQQILDYISSNYPSFVPYLSVPEIRSVLFEAARNHRGDANWANAQIEVTDWWKQHSATQREWYALSATDPATATTKVNDKVQELNSIAEEGGLSLSADQLKWEATAALANGWTDVMVRQQLLAAARQNNPTPAGGRTPGSIGLHVNDIRSLAAQYLIPISDQTAKEWAQALWEGSMSMDTIKGTLTAQARIAWGGKNKEFDDAIARGVTPRQFIDPQVQAVAQTLEMGPDQIDPLDPKWSDILNVDDGQGGTRMMSVPESKRWARGQQAYRFTDQANNQAEQVAQGILQTMGKAKF